MRALLLALVGVFVSTTLFTAEPKKPETPAEGLAAIIALLEKDDLTTLFRTRYGELDRFAKTDAEKEKIVAQMVQKFDKQKGTMLEAMRKAKEVEPEIVMQGAEKVAVYKVGKQTMRLYLKDGLWTFHL